MRSCINKSMKLFAEYDANVPEVKEFAKLWIKAKKGSGIMPKEFKTVSSRNGFVGAGDWTYEYNGKKFYINGFPNGKTFWGTDYSIRLVDEKNN